MEVKYNHLRNCRVFAGSFVKPPNSAFELFEIPKPDYSLNLNFFKYPDLAGVV
jgi:hypothetical protein